MLVMSLCWWSENTPEICQKIAGRPSKRSVCGWRCCVCGASQVRPGSTGSGLGGTCRILPDAKKGYPPGKDLRSTSTKFLYGSCSIAACIYWVWCSLVLSFHFLGMIVIWRQSAWSRIHWPCQNLDMRSCGWKSATKFKKKENDVWPRIFGPFPCSTWDI